MKEKVVRLRDNPRVRLRLTACFLSAAINGNSIARGGSSFRKSRVSGKLRRKRHNK